MSSDRLDEVEARYCEVGADGSVTCTLCPHRCRLTEGRRGLCRSREVRDGRLVSLAYGRVCALHVDPVEKKPLLHFHPGEMCLSLAAAGAYTYTEPLTWMEYTVDCARTCREAGLLNILVSAGYVNEGPLDDLLPYLDAANIDLKSFSDDIYRKVSRASLAPVLRTLEKMRDAGVWLEITNLLIPGINDDSGMLREMCRWLVDNGFAGAPLHFSRFFPQYRMWEVPPTPIGTLRMAEEIARECGIRYVHLGNV